MKFGKLSPKELESVDLKLPEDHHQTTEVLAQKGSKGKSKVYVGCAKWGRKEWVNLIYPKGTKDKNFLDEYVKNFNGIEMNTTFYSIKKTNVESWAARAPEGFKFCPKVSRNISHIKRINEDSKRYTDYFLDAALGFGDKLGPSFLQLPESFSGKYLERLRDYLKDLPDDYQLFVELRHTDWFTDQQVFDETFAMLEEVGVGAVITDVAGRRDVLHQRLSIPSAFVRFNGYNLIQSDYDRLDEWVQRAKSWIDQGIDELHFYAHQEDETNTPKTCDYFIEQLNEVCDFDLQRPSFLEQNPTIDFG